MSLVELVECPRCGGTAQSVNYGPIHHAACGYSASRSFSLELAAILTFAFFGIPAIVGLIIGFALLFVWFWTNVLGWFGLQ